MREGRGVFVLLLRYFFRRFFENDLLDATGDTVTTMARALAILAAPGLLLAFFMQNQYPQRSQWGRVEDHYFFVLYSFVAMAGVAVFEWEMLFPDRLDFLVLSPLPLRRRDLLGAKAGALAVFLALFLLAANVFGWGMFSVVSQERFGAHLWAHGVAVLCAGVFGALAILAAGGMLLCLLPARAFRVISPLLQMMVVAVLGLLLIHYVRFGDVLDQSLSIPLGTARFVPTFWFLGVYERLLNGDSAPTFARSMSHIAAFACLIAFSIVVVTYPMAWVRIRRMTLEGEAGLRGRPAVRMGALVKALVPLPPRRAVVSFIGQTMARNSRYQVYLAMYSGTGLALATACAVTFVRRGNALQPALSSTGLHAIMPLLLFWAVVGLRMAFALPMNLPARWIFRLTGAARGSCISGGRVWALACGLGILMALLPILWLAGFGGRALLVQAATGVCLCSFMVDCLMFADRGIPFAQPRSPGRTSLPLMLTLFVGVLPIFCFGMVRLEVWLERKPLYLLAGIILVPVVHTSVGAFRRRSQPELEDGDGIESEFQLLGLGVE